MCLLLLQQFISSNIIVMLYYTINCVTLGRQFIILFIIFNFFFYFKAELNVFFKVYPVIFTNFSLIFNVKFSPIKFNLRKWRVIIKKSIQICNYLQFTWNSFIFIPTHTRTLVLSSSYIVTYWLLHASTGVWCVNYYY